MNLFIYYLKLSLSESIFFKLKKLYTILYTANIIEMGELAVSYISHVKPITMLGSAHHVW